MQKGLALAWLVLFIPVSQAAGVSPLEWGLRGGHEIGTAWHRRADEYGESRAGNARGSRWKRIGV